MPIRSYERLCFDCPSWAIDEYRFFKLKSLDKKRKSLTKNEAIDAMQRYCAYQDRCHREVRTRLLEHQVYGHDLEEVMTSLILDDFLNEERYARSYARGKFRINKWGRNKILQHLKYNQISPYCIKKGMSEIDEEDYMETLRKLMVNKVQDVKAGNIYTRRNKVKAYLVQKGYESGLINQVLAEYLKADK